MARNTSDAAFETAAEDDADVEYVGLGGAGQASGTPVPVYYDDRDGTFFGAETDAEEGHLQRLSEYQWGRSPSQSIGEVIEDIGDELGWDSLSEFAQEHLEDDDS